MVLKPGTTYTLWARICLRLLTATCTGVILSSSSSTKHRVTRAELFSATPTVWTPVPSGDALTFKVIGGVIDLFVFTGPLPAEAAAQYTARGSPRDDAVLVSGIPPVQVRVHDFGGRRTCRRTSAAAIPLDNVMDIDYMSEGRTDLRFVNFPPAQVKDFVDDPRRRSALRGHRRSGHSEGRRFWNQSYAPYEDGSMGIFVEDGFRRTAHVAGLAGPTVMPDWSTQRLELLAIVHQGLLRRVAFDGLWTDMNEVSNFCNDGGQGQVRNANPDKMPDAGRRR